MTALEALETLEREYRKTARAAAKGYDTGYLAALADALAIVREHEVPPGWSLTRDGDYWCLIAPPSNTFADLHMTAWSERQRALSKAWGAHYARSKP